MKALITIHLCIRNGREEQTPTQQLGTLHTVASCLHVAGRVFRALEEVLSEKLEAAAG